MTTQAQAQTISERDAARREQVAREDLVMFVNACFACTGQREFYSTGADQRVSIDFLHQYILGNYRRLYARTLAAGINHFNQAQIVLNLLASGRDVAPNFRAEEGALIAATLRALPPQRAWRLLETLRRRKVNNRRSRAVVREYLAGRRDISFDAVKYRSKVRSAASHAHLTLDKELGGFLYGDWHSRAFQTPLFDAFRRAHYAAEAIYELPFTVAEGLAVKHSIPRETFLARITPRMTEGEKLRLQTATADLRSVALTLNWERLPLTRLALYVLSLPVAERQERRDALHQALAGAARHALARSPLSLGRVAAVLDVSYSTGGSTEKRRRPLGVALAAHYLLQVAAAEYRPFWTTPVDADAELSDALFLRPRGQTDLATPLLDALAWKPETVVIVSDGCENDPPRGASEVLRVFRTRLDPARRVSIVHTNPVFQPDDFSLRPLSHSVPTVGLREAEDLPTMLGFARFAEGTAALSELEAYLETRVRRMLVMPTAREGPSPNGSA